MGRSVSKCSQITYLVPLVEHGSNPPVVLRGTAAHAGAALEVDHPWQLLVVATGLRVNCGIQARDAAGKEPQGAIIRLAVVYRDVEEQLCHAKLS